MPSPLQARAAALALSALATLVTLAALSTTADRQYRLAAGSRAMALAQAEAAAPVQQVVVTGRRVQQAVITRHRRG